MKKRKKIKKKKAKVEISAGGVVYKSAKNKDGKEKIKFLLIKDSYGQWALPKGHLEEKENIFHAAIREIIEETGLKKLYVKTKLDYSKYFFKEKGKLILKVVYYFLMETPKTKRLRIDKKEIQDAKWFTPQVAYKKIAYKDLKPIIKKAINFLEDKMGENLEDFEKNIGINFKNKKLLKNVFIHRSYLNENRRPDLESNERLEFLGDAVLELVVTEYMYRKYKNPEGELTSWRAALVNGKKLSSIARKFEMGKYLFLSRGEEKMGGRNRELLLANAFEALIGAIYLEKGYKVAQKFLLKHLLNKLPEIIDKKIYLDPKTELQERAQEEWGITPTYEVLKEEGPDHAKNFTVAVFINDKKMGEGSGSSKQAAQISAASNALKKMAK